MKTIGTVALLFIAAVVAWWAAGIVMGIVAVVLHWAIVLAIVGGIGYVCYALSNPRRSLGWRSKILP